MVISNLFLALALSTGWGAQGLKAPTDGYSHVLGTSCTFYYDSDYDFLIGENSSLVMYRLNLRSGTWQSYNPSFTYIDQNESYNQLLKDLYSSQTAFYPSDLPVGLDYNDFAYVFIAYETNMVEYDVNYDCVVRFGVPYDSYINGIEIHNNNGEDVCTFVFDSYCAYQKYESLESDNESPLYLGLYDDNPFYQSSDWNITDNPTDEMYSKIPFMFSNFGLVTNATILYSRARLNLHLSFLGIDYTESVDYHRGWRSGYDRGYDVGHDEGFDEGKQIGKQEGIQIGLEQANQGGWFNLFGAIADTPIRMLYGLFNFDLFGISVLSVVLTMLTGLIVIGLIKKFYK